ncbi:MAG: hypothetical protein WEA80_02015 [Gemmatimonadaceae bacterium]
MTMTAWNETVLTTINAVTCCSCGVLFGLENGHQARLRKSHEGFYCPNGHIQYYLAQTEIERKAWQLARDLENTERCLKYAREGAAKVRLQRDAANRSVTARKGVITKMKRRAKAGRCPCCSEVFKNLRAHMKTNHPKYEPEKHVAALERQR